MRAGDIEVAPGVTIHPYIMSGAPSVTGRRISTELLAVRFCKGKSPELLAKDYDIPVISVYDALRYQYRLHIAQRYGGLRPIRKRKAPSELEG